MSESVLSAIGVTRQFSGRTHPAVDDVTLELAAGETVGLVGESGSGKSTLARMMVGLDDPTSGTVRVGDTAWADVVHRDPVRRSVQMIFQDPYRSLNPRMTGRQTVAEVVRFWSRVPTGEANHLAELLLAEVGLGGDVLDRRPGRMSGGQRQRIGIARALASSPDVLIADEPTASLDVSVQAQILNVLLDLKARRGLTLLMVTHDLGVVRHMADRVVVMRQGRFVEVGDCQGVFLRPTHPYTKALLESVPGFDPGG